MNTMENHMASMCEAPATSNSQANLCHLFTEDPVEAPGGYRVLVECLAGATTEPTVIIDSDGAHRFIRLFRAFRQTRRAPVTPASADTGLALLSQAARTHASYSGNLPGRDGEVLTRCVPVLGPSGAVHALRMDIGDIDPAGGPPVIALEFDSRYIARFGTPHGPMPVLFRTDTTWTLPALLERVVWLDKRLELIAMFDPIEPAPRWCGSLVLDDPTTNTRRHLWMAVRSVTDYDGMRIVRAVIADITAMIPAPSWDPLTEHLSTRTTRGHGSALMDLRTTLMHSFCCHDDPRLAPWRHSNPQLHPADIPAVMTVLGDLADNRPARITMRIRFSDDAPWTTLRAECSPLANYPRAQANIDFWIEEPTLEKGASVQ